MASVMMTAAGTSEALKDISETLKRGGHISTQRPGASRKRPNLKTRRGGGRRPAAYCLVSLSGALRNNKEPREGARSRGERFTRLGFNEAADAMIITPWSEEMS